MLSFIRTNGNRHFPLEAHLEAAIEAREQGLVRFIGVTGHGWNAAAMHRRSLMRFNFDSVLIPWNYFASLHPTYALDFSETLQICKERDVAVQTIKSIARGPWSAGARKEYSTWYLPLEYEKDIWQSISWILSYQGIFLNTVGDMDLLPVLLNSAANPGERPTDSQMQDLSERAGLSSIFGL